MGKLDIIGSLRGTIIDSGFSLTSKENPQFVMKLQATEWYDEETKAWYDNVEPNEADITAFMVLFGADGNPLFNVGDIMEVLKWDGKSFGALNGLGVDTGIQFRTENHTYNGKTSIQVAGLSDWDAAPGGPGVKKLDDSKISEIDAKFGAALAKLSGAGKPAAPATAGKKKPATGKAKTPKKDAPKTPKKDAPKAPPKAPKEEDKVKAEDVVTPMDQDKAWAEVCKLQVPELSDARLAELWLDAIGEDDQDTLTDEQWGKVYETVKMNILDDTCPF